MLNFDGQDNLNIFKFKEFENRIYCNSFVATAIVGAAAVGAAATIYSSGKAADAQRDAANTANAGVEARFQQIRSDLLPYNQAGIAANDELQQRLPFLTSPIKMDQATLEKTPGYEFTRYQGLKSVQNSAAARGLGVSGAALKGASAFATGLANNTYKDQFNLENINRTNAYDRLKGLIDVGENAAAQTGVLGTSASKTESANTVGAGNASAAAYNAQGGAIGGAARDIGGYYAYKGLYGDPNPSSSYDPMSGA
mgnify:CR=1 FL=1